MGAKNEVRIHLLGTMNVHARFHRNASKINHHPLKKQNTPGRSLIDHKTSTDKQIHTYIYRQFSCVSSSLNLGLNPSTEPSKYGKKKKHKNGTL